MSRSFWCGTNRYSTSFIQNNIKNEFGQALHHWRERERIECLPLIFISSRDREGSEDTAVGRGERGTSQCQAGRAGGGESLHGEGTCIRTCLRGMAFRERGCSYRICGSGVREKAGERAQEFRLPPWAMRNQTGPDRVFFGSYKLWHWSRKQAGMGRGRKADLFGVCVNSVSIGFIPLFPPPTAASTVPFT